MTATTEQRGRFCNQLIRNLCTSLVAERHDLRVDHYSSRDRLLRLGIPLFSGEKRHEETRALTDDNFFALLLAEEPLRHNLNPNTDYFQSREISRFLHRHLHELPSILRQNPYAPRYRNNEDCFVHVRLGDAAPWNPGAAYYADAVRRTGAHHIFVATDSPEHPLILEVQRLLAPQGVSFELYLRDEVDTLQFGSTCRHVVLSHGSFSAVLGWLAFYSSVYFPAYDPSKLWYGDMFCIDGWHQIDTEDRP